MAVSPENSFSGLPDAVAVAIIVKLDPWDRLLLSATSRKFAALIQHSDCWKDIRSLNLGADKGFGRAITLRLRAILPKCGTFVKRVVFNSSVHSVQLSLLQRFCPHLTSLELNVGLVNDQLHMVGTRLGDRLRSLSLQRVFAEEDFVLERLLERCPLLEELYVGQWNSELQGGFIRGLFRCQQLRILSLPISFTVNNVALAKFLLILTDRVVSLDLSNWDLRNCASLLSRFRHLSALKLSGTVRLDPINGILSDFTRMSGGNHLTYLDMSRVNCLSDDSIEAISACEELKVLNLEGSGEFSPESLLSLARCARLECLNLTEVRHVDASIVVDLLADLKCLKMLAAESRSFPPQLVSNVCKQAPWIELLAVWHVDDGSLVGHLNRLAKEKLKLRRLFVTDVDNIREETVEALQQEFGCDVCQQFQWPFEWPTVARMAVAQNPVPLEMAKEEESEMLETAEVVNGGVPNGEC